MRKWMVVMIGLALVGVLAVGAWARQGQPAGQGKMQHKQRMCQQNGQGAGACQTAKVAAATVTGNVTALVQPDAGMRGPAQFTLVAGDAKTAVRLGPAWYLAELGLAVKDGDAVSVTGWTVTAGEQTFIIARELTVHEKTYTLRGEDGFPAWMAAGGCAMGSSGCAMGSSGCVMGSSGCVMGSSGCAMGAGQGQCANTGACDAACPKADGTCPKAEGSCPNASQCDGTGLCKTGTANAEAAK